MESRQTLDVSWETILKIFIAGFILYVLFLVRDIVVWFFFAIIISLLLEPAIKFLRKLKIPKLLAVALVYFSIMGFVGLMIYLIAPSFASEIKQFTQNIPEYFIKVSPVLRDLGFDVARNFQDITVGLLSQLQESSTSVIRAVTVFFGGIASTLIIFIFAFYISLEENGPERFLALLTPKKYEETVVSVFEKVQVKVAGWFGARLLACLFVGVGAFIVFLLFGIKYSFVLALVAGVLNFVPFIGPLVTAILAFLSVGVSSSWILAIYIAIALYVIQAIENNIVTPLLMKKFIDLPPVLVLIALLVGGTIFGLMGTIFVVPVFGVVYEFFKEFLEKRKREMSA